MGIQKFQKQARFGARAKRGLGIDMVSGKIQYFCSKRKGRHNALILLAKMVGAAGIEPATPTMSM